MLKLLAFNIFFSIGHQFMNSSRKISQKLFLIQKKNTPNTRKMTQMSFLVHHCIFLIHFQRLYIYCQLQFFHKMKKDFQEWISWAKQKKKFIAFYKQITLDLTQFIKIHPGGKKSLETYLQKDVSNFLFSVYPHKKQTTVNTLLKYTIGINMSFNKKQSDLKEKDNKLPMSDTKQKKKVCFINKFDDKIQQNGQISQRKERNNGSMGKRSAKIRKTINQRSKSKRHHTINRHQVSIKLISQSQIAHYESTIRQQSIKKAQKRKMEQQIDKNINHQDLEQQSTISAIPVFQITQLNK